MLLDEDNPWDPGVEVMEAIVDQVRRRYDFHKVTGTLGDTRLKEAHDVLQSMVVARYKGIVDYPYDLQRPAKQKEWISYARDALADCLPASTIDCNRTNKTYRWVLLERRTAATKELARLGVIVTFKEVKDSEHRIFREPVEPEVRVILKQVLRSVAPQLVQPSELYRVNYEQLSIEAVYNGASSSNFCVSYREQPLWLLRLLSRLRNAQDLLAVQELERKVAASGLFDASASKYMVALARGRVASVPWSFGPESTALTSKHLFERKPGPDGRIDCRVSLRSYFPEVYAGTIHHFRATLPALRSFAERLGALHSFSATQLRDTVDWERLNALRPDLRPGADEVIGLADGREKAKAHVLKLRSDHPKFGEPLAQIWESVESDLDSHAAEVAIEFAATEQRNPFGVLRDLHPGNSFHDALGNCRAIFDLDGFGTSWTHEAAVGFALHRFTREYVVDALKKGTLKTPEAVCQATAAFMEGYREGYKAAPALNADFLDRLPYWIMASNLRKMFSRVRKLSTERDDKANNANLQNIRRVRAFAMFVREAPIYRGCVRVLTGR